MTPVMNLETRAAEEPIFRAPVRRTSATNTTERTRELFERVLSELTAEIEAAALEYETIQTESARESAHFETRIKAANVTLKEQAATINRLKAQVSELLGNVQTLRSSVEPGMALIARPLPEPIVIHQTVEHRNEGRAPYSD